MNVNLGLRATATSLSLSPFLQQHSLPDYNKCATLAPTTLAYCGEVAGGAAQLRSATNQRRFISDVQDLSFENQF